MQCCLASEYDCLNAHGGKKVKYAKSNKVKLDNKI